MSTEALTAVLVTVANRTTADPTPSHTGLLTSLKRLDVGLHQAIWSDLHMTMLREKNMQ